MHICIYTRDLYIISSLVDRETLDFSGVIDKAAEGADAFEVAGRINHAVRAYFAYAKRARRFFFMFL